MKKKGRRRKVEVQKESEVFIGGHASVRIKLMLSNMDSRNREDVEDQRRCSIDNQSNQAAVTSDQWVQD